MIVKSTEGGTGVELVDRENQEHWKGDRISPYRSRPTRYIQRGQKPDAC